MPDLGTNWSDLASPTASAMPARRPADTTNLILGRHRALILRTLDRPANMGGLTAALNYTPSALTYQCTRLEQAGLITLQRRGREVLVSRTERGSALLDLLAGD